MKDIDLSKQGKEEFEKFASKFNYSSDQRKELRMQ